MNDAGDIIEAFGALSHEALDEHALLSRVDMKFLLRTHELSCFLGRLVGEYGVLLAGTARLASYQTLYYDTSALRCYREHRFGQRPRDKVRIRHYLDREVSYLEVKRKHPDGTTDKKRRRREFLNSFFGDKDRRYVDKHSRLSAAALRPHLWTNFSRLTLLNLHACERLTIDTHIVARRESLSATLSELVIVEVKQPSQGHMSPALLALQAMGKFQVSASKYCIATELTRGRSDDGHCRASLAAAGLQG